MTTFAVMHTVAFVWALLQLRADAGQRLAAELDLASQRPAPSGSIVTPSPASENPDVEPRGAVALTVTAAAASDARGADPGGPTPRPWSRRGPVRTPPAGSVGLPTWTRPRPFSEAGITGWFRDRLGERPSRADRSSTLAHEGGGRLDRLDLWFLVVLLLATLGMRTFRLAEPYQMHFDEVYHARTATEFLQGWRYGLDHDIYEWTHPHLAKYAMAGGLVLWGEDDVRELSDLGTPVAAAAIEPRWDDVVSGDPAGERVHVATGTEIRSYDLRSRELVSVIAAAGSRAVAVDQGRSQLLIGFDDGRIATVDLTVIGLGWPGQRPGTVGGGPRRPFDPVSPR